MKMASNEGHDSAHVNLFSEGDTSVNNKKKFFEKSSV